MDVFYVAKLYFAVSVVSALATVLVAASLKFIGFGIQSGSGVVDHYEAPQVYLA